MAGSRSEAEAAVQHMMDSYKYIAWKTGYQGFDTEVMYGMRLLEAQPSGYVRWELDISPLYANQNEIMHGGAYGLIFDMATVASLYPVARPGYWSFQAGVTRSLNISYLASIPLNITIIIESTLIQHGRTMALIHGKMISMNGNKVYATCEHHKVNTSPLPDNQKMSEEMRAETTRRGSRAWLDDLRKEIVPKARKENKL